MKIKNKKMKIIMIKKILKVNNPMIQTLTQMILEMIAIDRNKQNFKLRM